MIAISITVYFLQVHTSYLWDPVRKVVDLAKVSSMRSDKKMTQCFITRQLWVWKLRQSPSPTVLTISRLFLSFQYQCKLFHHSPDYWCRSFGYWGSQALLNMIILTASLSSYLEFKTSSTPATYQHICKHHHDHQTSCPGISVDPVLSQFSL